MDKLIEKIRLIKMKIHVESDIEGISLVKCNETERAFVYKD